MPRVAADQREALAQSRRDQIVEAAVRRWLVDGFDATTVASIAREAGLAKGTVYIYFRTKQEILDEVIRRYSLVPDLRGFLEGVGDVPSRELIPGLVRGFWAVLKQRVDIVQLLARELSVRPEHARTFVESIVIPANQIMADHFRADIEAGTMRDIDMFIASRALIGMLVAILFTQHVFGGHDVYPLDDERIVTTISDLFLNGVMSRGEEG